MMRLIENDFKDPESAVQKQFEKVAKTLYKEEDSYQPCDKSEVVPVIYNWAPSVDPSQLSDLPTLCTATGVMYGFVKQNTDTQYNELQYQKSLRELLEYCKIQ